MPDIPKLPRGHGGSFKRGVCDAILHTDIHRGDIAQEGHGKSYREGLEYGTALLPEVEDKGDSFKLGLRDRLLDTMDNPYEVPEEQRDELYDDGQKFGDIHKAKIGRRVKD